MREVLTQSDLSHHLLSRRVVQIPDLGLTNGHSFLAVPALRVWLAALPEVVTAMPVLDVDRLVSHSESSRGEEQG